MTSNGPAFDRAGGDDFATTRWSIVVAAGERSTGESQQALAQLCELYWYPLYAYTRRRLHSLEAAQDAVQNFFAALLEKNLVAAADPERGRFRAFLLTSLKNFLATQWERDQAIKRGGDRKLLSLDFAAGESRYQLEPVDHVTPELLFERQWALALLAEVLSRLRSEFETNGKTAEFEVLKTCLAGDAIDGGYTAIATRLGTSEGAARVAGHRLRQRYRELLRSAIADTVASAADIDDEIRRLFEVVGR
jgi:DNA-directed RNA polymerase specialized sigma24 family protein